VGRPSHTTGHTGPYPAVRLVKTGTDKFHPVCRALIKQNATDIFPLSAGLHYVGKNMLFDNRDHLPEPFGVGTVRAFIGVRPPGILLPHREARLVSADYYALC
jgi:hypothetical protein